MTKPQPAQAPTTERAREPGGRQQALNDRRAGGGGPYLHDHRPMPGGGTASGDPPIQRVTKIEYGQPHAFNFDNPASAGNNGLAAQAQVGSTVTASLDLTDPLQGSEPTGGGNLPLARTDTQTKHGGAWVLGHLINDDLGGLGVERNLFPITHEANMEHYYSVERKVKNLLYRQPGAGLNLANDGYVAYTVTATPVGAGNSVFPNVIFNCTWNTQIPQVGGGPAVWGAAQNAVIVSRPDDAVAVPPAWASAGAALRAPAAPLHVTRVVVGALPLGLQAGIPGGAVAALVQGNGTPAARVAGWEL